MVYHAQQDSRGKRVSEKLNAKDINKDNNSTYFTFYILFVNYKRGKVETSHLLSWYDKEQLPYMTSTQPVLFDEVHIQQVRGPPTASKCNKHNIRFPRDEDRNVDVKRGKYDMNNQS